MGSKLRLLDFIAPAIVEIHKSNFTFVDLMAGTHSVGYSLRDYARVVSNDIQNYASVIGTALVVNSTIGHVPSELRQELANETATLSTEGWFTNTYADTYFSHTQCREIETIRAAISLHRNEPLRSILLTALIYAMGYSQSSPGHFAQYMPSDHPRVQSLRSLSVRSAFQQYLNELLINTSGSSNAVYQLDVHKFLAHPPSSLLESPVVAYLDPPYSPAQYSRYYHLLETVILDDEPEVAFKGLYRPNRFASQFCSARGVYDEFCKVFGRVSELGWELAVSYGTHALLPTDELVSLAKNYYSDVSLSERCYPHSMQGRGVVQDRKELLLVCRN